jgi:hypothetical protein
MAWLSNCWVVWYAIKFFVLDTSLRLVLKLYI